MALVCQRRLVEPGVELCQLGLKLAAQSAELMGFVHEVVASTIQIQTRTIVVGMAGALGTLV